MNLICDFCGKESINTDTIILYNKKITYCEYCEGKAIQIKNEFKNILQEENKGFDAIMKAKENNLLKKYKLKV